MAESIDEIVVPLTLHVFAAPKGTPLPEHVPVDAEAYEGDNLLDPDFVELGFTSTDGSRFASSKTTSEINVHQRLEAARIIPTGASTQAQFVLSQFNGDNLITAFGGGKVSTVTSGGNTSYRYDPPNPEDLKEIVCVMDAVDGDKIMRFVLASGMVDGETAVTFARTDAQALPVTLKAVATSSGASWYVLSNDDSLLSELGGS